MQPQHRLIKFPRLNSSVLVPRKELQLVGISSMLIASRYEELLLPKCSSNLKIIVSFGNISATQKKEAEEFGTTCFSWEEFL
ncbi:eukaryotic long-chain fatty acid CoA synthetase (LC-FACS) [Trifolium repens]|nr:eukaryotic long-chain fatty acid CoA synthetase (LC-FACS) [Trifolium repens]